MAKQDISSFLFVVLEACTEACIEACTETSLSSFGSYYLLLLTEKVVLKGRHSIGRHRGLFCNDLSILPSLSPHHIYGP